MAVRVGINGFGRIGMLTAKAAIERSDDDIEIVAINDLMPMESLALLFKRDTVHGIWPEDVELLYSERDRTAPRLAEIAESLPFTL